jgi:hypothetical protein
MSKQASVNDRSSGELKVHLRFAARAPLREKGPRNAENGGQATSCELKNRGLNAISYYSERWQRREG